MFPQGLFVASSFLLVLVFDRGPAAWQAVVHGVKSGTDWDQRAFDRKFFEIAVGRSGDIEVQRYIHNQGPIDNRAAAGSRVLTCDCR